MSHPDAFALIIIGDEILHGSRQDGHFAYFKSLLETHGLKLAQVQYLPDERALLTRALRRSFADGTPAFVTGGIGATPDDHTRQAAAAALGVPLERHAEAARLIETVSLKHGSPLDSPEHARRLEMADFPQGSALIPNPYNGVAGFAVQEHYFLPGFPVMAHPMAEWVLQTHYATAFHQIRRVQHTVWLVGQPESRIAPLMLAVESIYPGIRSFSLPSVGGTAADGRSIPPHIEFGIKAEGAACQEAEAAWQFVLRELAALGIEWHHEAV